MSDPSARIVILSDTHLGRPGSAARSADALRPLWRGASRLIINGDAAELADDQLRAEAARHVVRIQRYCEEDGVELTLLPGNHDPMISDVRYLRLAGGEVFVTHGDALHPAISPWTSHRDQLARFHAYARHALGRSGPIAPDRELDAALAAVQYAAHFTWDDWHWHHHPGPPAWMRVLPKPLRDSAEYAAKVTRVLWYWHTMPRRAADFARRFAPEARFFIYGHIHRAGIWHFPERGHLRGRGRGRGRGREHFRGVLINTGSYDFPSRPHAVVIEDQSLRVHHIRRTHDHFELAPPTATFPLIRAA